MYRSIVIFIRQLFEMTFYDVHLFPSLFVFFDVCLLVYLFDPV